MYELEVIKKPIKHFRLKVTISCKVVATVPHTYKDKDIQNVLNKKKDWIENKIKQFQQAKSLITLKENQILLFWKTYTFYREDCLKNKVNIDHNKKTIRSGIDFFNTKKQIKRYKKYAKSELVSKVQETSKKTHIKCNKIFIRDQKTKWGSCSSRKNIWLNWRLVKMPANVIDYVICHELTHIKEMNHTKRFWMLLENICPYKDDAIKWIKKYGISLY